MSKNNSVEADGAAPDNAAIELHKYVAPISDNRKLYFYTFGDESLELPEGAVLAESDEASHV